MDLSSRLRAIVKGGPPKPLRELTYEPDIGGYEAVMDLSRVGAILGGQPAETPFGQCLVIDRRYEADRFHGAIRIGECEVEDFASLAILDPSLAFCQTARSYVLRLRVYKPPTRFSVPPDPGVRPRALACGLRAYRLTTAS